VAPDHTTSCNRSTFGTACIPCHLINAPQWSPGYCVGLSWLCRVGKKPSGKAYLAICGYFITVSG